MSPQYDEEVHARIGWTINCILNISKFFCAAPLVNIQLRSCVRRPLPQLAPKFSILRYLPHILWTIAYAGLLAIGMLYALFQSIQNIIQVEQFLFVARYLCNTFTLWICFVGCQWQCSAYQLFFDEVTTVGRRLVRFDIDRTRSASLLLHLRVQIGILLGYLMVIVLIDLLYNEWQLVETFWSLMAHFVPSLTATCVMLQFATAMCVLEQLFGHIVDLVERVLASQDQSTGPRGGNLSLTPLLGLAARSGSEWQPEEPTQQAAILASLRREHVELMAITGRLADSFGLAIIGVVVSGILDLTVNLFVFYKTAVNSVDAGVGGKVYALAWMVMIGGRIFAVMWGCERVNRMRREIAPAMFQVEINGALITADLDRLIEQFSLQLLHDDSDRQLAAGLMPLNMQLLSTVFGALTVYMVILIQFDASERKTD